MWKCATLIFFIVCLFVTKQQTVKDYILRLSFRWALTFSPRTQKHVVALFCEGQREKDSCDLRCVQFGLAWLNTHLHAPHNSHCTTHTRTHTQAQTLPRTHKHSNTNTRTPTHTKLTYTSTPTLTHTPTPTLTYTPTNTHQKMRVGLRFATIKYFSCQNEFLKTPGVVGMAWILVLLPPNCYELLTSKHFN